MHPTHTKILRNAGLARNEIPILSLCLKEDPEEE